MFPAIVMLTREASGGEIASAQEPALGHLGLVGAATAVARREDGEACVVVTVCPHLQRLQLQPANGPIEVV